MSKHDIIEVDNLINVIDFKSRALCFNGSVNDHLRPISFGKSVSGAIIFNYGFVNAHR